ncbi:hypothetical protein BV898_05173 [Hypsibius exemplaris]|uniref:RING-type domain-containing protein n=1 Tax=Hypsibius exemplaris TaxID=2072580 RepID=A0A1W0X084_HYPEX|nr:hypothetical protein BV898_05173 [Hypsibius exemplaris]
MDVIRHLPRSALMRRFKCGICDGLLIDAVALPDCEHAYCRSCIVQHCWEWKKDDSNCRCPNSECRREIRKTMPWEALRSHTDLQAIIYKLFPDAYEEEMARRREFYCSNPPTEKESIAYLGRDLTPEELGMVSRHFPWVIPTVPDVLSVQLRFRGVLRKKNAGHVSSPRWETLQKRVEKNAGFICFGVKSSTTVAGIRNAISVKFGLMHPETVLLSRFNSVLHDHLSIFDLIQYRIAKTTNPLILDYALFDQSAFPDTCGRDLALAKLFLPNAPLRPRLNRIPASSIVRSVEVLPERDAIALDPPIDEITAPSMPPSTDDIIHAPDSPRIFATIEEGVVSSASTARESKNACIGSDQVNQMSSASPLPMFGMTLPETDYSIQRDPYSAVSSYAHFIQDGHYQFGHPPSQLETLSPESDVRSDSKLEFSNDMFGTFVVDSQPTTAVEFTEAPAATAITQYETGISESKLLKEQASSITDKDQHDSDIFGRLPLSFLHQLQAHILADVAKLVPHLEIFRLKTLAQTEANPNIAVPDDLLIPLPRDDPLSLQGLAQTSMACSAYDAPGQNNRADDFPRYGKSLAGSKCCRDFYDSGRVDGAKTNTHNVISTSTPGDPTCASSVLLPSTPETKADRKPRGGRKRSRKGLHETHLTAGQYANTSPTLISTSPFESPVDRILAQTVMQSQLAGCLDPQFPLNISGPLPLASLPTVSEPLPIHYPELAADFHAIRTRQPATPTIMTTMVQLFRQAFPCVPISWTGLLYNIFGTAFQQIHIFIHCVRGHYLTSSWNPVAQLVELYDSTSQYAYQLDPAAKFELWKVYCGQQPNLEILHYRFNAVQDANHAADSGYFALAFAFELAGGTNRPMDMSYRAEELRNWVDVCFSAGRLWPSLMRRPWDGELPAPRVWLANQDSSGASRVETIRREDLMGLEEERLRYSLF